MKFKIHRGTQEIGGSCVEIWTETTTIIIDFGMPLVNPDKTQFNSNEIKNKSAEELIETGVLPDIVGLYKKTPSFALILSHAHQDHYGLINYMHDNCSVYLGESTLKLIELTNIFTNQNWKILNPHHFKSGLAFNIGDIEITPYLMDHSAFDAYAFLIKADGKSLFYSGDFRIHGRKKRAFDWFSYNVEQNIDYLLLEGTTLGRDDYKCQSEDEIEAEFVEIFKKPAINLIYTSGQNIDRLVSIYKACKAARKIFAVDFYIANILTDLAAIGASIPYPSPRFPEVKVFFPYKLSRKTVNQGNAQLMYRFKNFKITKEQIDQQFDKVVMIVRPSMIDDLQYIKNLNNGIFTYSLWNGYRKEKSTKEFIETLIARGMEEKILHTSGHADREGLKRMVEVLKPKNLIPIHTFNASDYQSIFENVNVLVLKDNQIIDC